MSCITWVPSERISLKSPQEIRVLCAEWMGWRVVMVACGPSPPQFPISVCSSKTFSPRPAEIVLPSPCVSRTYLPVLGIRAPGFVPVSASTFLCDLNKLNKLNFIN